PASSRRARVPAAAGVVVGQVRAEQPASPVEGNGHVLDMDVKDAVGKAADESYRVDPLPVQVGGVEGEAKLVAAAQGVEDHLGAVQVEGDLAGVDLEGVADAALRADVEDGRPAADELAQSLFHRFRPRRGVA